MGMTVRSVNCWICVEPALTSDGRSLEPFEVSVALAAVAHVRCLPLADLARRSVYQAVDASRLGPNRVLVLHVRTSGNGLLCKNELEPNDVPKRRVGAVRDFGGVIGFCERSDACAVCARELAAQVKHRAPKTALREAARTVTAEEGEAKVVAQAGSSNV